MRVRFSEVFQQNADASYSPKCMVSIGGIALGAGVSFTPGVSFSGVDIANYADRDLEVEQRADAGVEIKGVY